MGSVTPEICRTYFCNSSAAKRSGAAACAGADNHVIRTAAGCQRQTVRRAGQLTETRRNQQEREERLRRIA